jgi:recombinational DNA repair protein RecR
MNTATIRQKLYDYIKIADDKKVKAIYTIIESDLSEMTNWWNDEKLIEELDKRSTNLKSGKDQGVTWEELKRELISQTPNGL